ncbi:hypothetical protein IW15_17025 [Chryseobacterium soli]|uniref:Leucine-rich repeat domain-containing protein n=1 Tax=Chryseobacterium soli TaxID=445961 RepID=A0A086A2G8_9FLAO|nr:leucine-rich repeat domain-containing protein [Chryseobacterium soli]KFF10882.1 hypothetical protein IW15_17025 [Chryseobacterium soli]
MTDFIKKIEKEFDTQIILSNKHIKAKNYYDVDEDGNVKTLFLRQVNLKELDVLLPIAESVVNLAVIGCHVKNLRALKSFTRLEKLSLRLNNLHGSTLGYLSYLKNLKKLDLRGTNLKDTSFLGYLTNLEMLLIGGSDRLYEVKNLEGLTSLYHLDASYSQIDSIKKVSANKNISSLNIEGIKIEKIEHLEQFPNLESLKLDGTFVEKIEGLESLKNLKEFFISTGRIKRIEGLENMTGLEVLDLNFNQISKIEGLDNLTNLKWLSLNENQVNKVENLDSLIHLELLLLEPSRDVSYFDTTFFNNLVSECQIYIRGIKDLDKIEAIAPKNVKINYNKDYRYPTTLYRGPRDIFE